jgi:hypothetical protein
VHCGQRGVRRECGDRQGGQHDEIIPVVREIGGLEGAMAMVMLLSDA